MDDILGIRNHSEPDDSPPIERPVKINFPKPKPTPKYKYADQEGAVWGHLHSLRPNLKNVELRNKRISIGRLPTSEIQIIDQRLS